jgi:hypothetical protein
MADVGNVLCHAHVSDIFIKCLHAFVEVILWKQSKLET